MKGSEIIILGIVLLYFALSCNYIPEPLTWSERRKGDSIYSAQKELLTESLDSTCLANRSETIKALYDSLLEAELRNIEKLRHQ